MEEGVYMAVLAETTAQVLVDDVVTLPLPAEKIDEIVASIRDAQCFVIDNKVIFQGTLHKQIFFVDMEGIVRHVGVDIPFSGFVDVPGVPAGSACQLEPEIEFLSFELVTPTQLRETVVIAMGVTVFDTPVQTLVFNQTLPTQPVVFGEPNTVRARAGGVLIR